MSMHMLLCNFTDQAVRNMKEMPTRRAAAREKAKKLGVEIKEAYLALGAYDFMIRVDAPDDETLAKFVLSLAGIGALRTTTVRLFTDDQYEQIVNGLV
ncbi:GYD domain-containing protein [Bradyrhizobium sp. ARR65]|uniref:GYD domain-containing protein n=1 Tax=Bradyrhizobium sp. ARR65 TaxID=1040989 RepID=UPI00046367A8|nr:GYD domain-containing protein [Bradyrhizobium sp. ARR65]